MSVSDKNNRILEVVKKGQMIDEMIQALEEYKKFLYLREEAQQNNLSEIRDEHGEIIPVSSVLASLRYYRNIIGNNFDLIDKDV